MLVVSAGCGWGWLAVPLCLPPTFIAPALPLLPPWPLWPVSLKKAAISASAKPSCAILCRITPSGNRIFCILTNAAKRPGSAIAPVPVPVPALPLVVEEVETGATVGTDGATGNATGGETGTTVALIASAVALSSAIFASFRPIALKKSCRSSVTLCKSKWLSKRRVTWLSP